MLALVHTFFCLSLCLSLIPVAYSVCLGAFVCASPLCKPHLDMYLVIIFVDCWRRLIRLSVCPRVIPGLPIWCCELSTRQTISVNVLVWVYVPNAFYYIDVFWCLDYVCLSVYLYSTCPFVLICILCLSPCLSYVSYVLPLVVCICLFTRESYRIIATLLQLDNTCFIFCLGSIIVDVWDLRSSEVAHC